MYPYDYGGFEEISKTRGNGVSCESIQLKYRDELIYCPNCESRDFTKYDTKEPRKVLDVYAEGRTVLLTFENKRCQCRNCKKVFNPNRYPTCIPEKARVSTSCLSDIADYVIEYPGMTHKQTADVFGVSPTVVSQAVHDRIEATERKSISTLDPTKFLFLYPFKYGGKLRYAVCGTDVHDKASLYDIRSDYTLEDIKLYFDRIRFQAYDVPWAIFIDFNEDIVSILGAAESLRPLDDIPSERGIIRQLLINKIKGFRASKTNNLRKVINQDLNELEQSLFEENTTPDDFPDKLKEWFDTPSDEDEEISKKVKEHLRPLYLLLDYFCPICALVFAYDPEEMEIEKYLDFIRVFRKRNTPFEEMRSQIMRHAENRENVPMQKLLNRSYKGLGVHNMRIDLHKINAIYQDTWNPADDGAIDDYPEFYKS